VKYAFTGFALIALCGQSAAAPAFEVASIKEALPLSIENVQAGHFHVGMNSNGSRADYGFMSLADLIPYAYSVKRYQLSGPGWSGPGWMNETRWDIAPKIRAGQPADRAQMAQVQPVPAKAKPAQAASARPADPPLAFDVASVRVTANPRARGFGYFTQYSPNTLNIRDMSMWMCIRLAYGVENFRIAGPDSMQNPPFYEIVAKAASPVPESQLRLMLRKLLADRFHLTLHWEKKEMSVTALLVAKGGSKMHPTTGAVDPAHGDDAHMQNLGYDNNVHIQRSAGANGNARFTFTNASMTLFATWLESSSSVFPYDKAPVVDLTGMQGRFDWAVDSPFVRPPGGGDGAGTPIVADGNTGGVLLDDYKPILERELGLTLQRRKAMVDILVIDHVDKEPTPN
jgi:uncharacterized protein (TIGR03435 family)